MLIHYVNTKVLNFYINFQLFCIYNLFILVLYYR
nr:MAG TPA: hypothetical protein [Caudoviricetes sp.]